jgi:hypothetical protein
MGSFAAPLRIAAGKLRTSFFDLWDPEAAIQRGTAKAPKEGALNGLAHSHQKKS